MYKQEEITPYHAGEKASQVEQMFDNIAPTYDKLNHRLSWDIDRGWRKKAILQLAPHQPQVILDIATGTGDFAILAAEMLHPEKLIGADISEGMMQIGREKVAQKGLDSIISFANYYSTIVPRFSPLAILTILAGSSIENTRIFVLLSLQRAAAVASMTLRLSLRTSS